MGMKWANLSEFAIEIAWISYQVLAIIKPKFQRNAAAGPRGRTKCRLPWNPSSPISINHAWKGQIWIYQLDQFISAAIKSFFNSIFAGFFVAVLKPSGPIQAFYRSIWHEVPSNLPPLVKTHPAWPKLFIIAMKTPSVLPPPCRNP